MRACCWLGVYGLEATCTNAILDRALTFMLQIDAGELIM